MAAEKPETNSLSDERRKALNLAITQIERPAARADHAVWARIPGTGGRDSPRAPSSSDAAIGVGGIPRGRVTEIFGRIERQDHLAPARWRAQRQGGAAAYIDASTLSTSSTQEAGREHRRLLVSQPTPASSARDHRDPGALGAVTSS